MTRSWQYRLAAGAAVLYVLLAAALSLAKAPYCDEAFLFSPALNLVKQGHMGTSVLDETSSWRDGMSLKDINRYTYQVMPVHFLVQAGWYRAVGFGLLQMRALSILWGLVALGAWFLIVQSLADDAGAAALVAVLLATDAMFLAAASFGRADMASAAPAFAALAVYLRLRECRLGLAVLASHALATVAIFTHPMAVFSVFSLAALTLYFDWRRLRIQHLLLAAAPYLAAAGGWGLYILQNPDAFRAQFSSNAQGRFHLGTPWAIVWTELRERYLPAFGSVKVIVLAAYGAALAGCASVRVLRKHAGCRALLLITAVQLLSMAVLEGTKQDFYLVHTIPALTAVLAVFVWWCWRRGGAVRWAAAAAVCAVMGIQLARVAHVVRMDLYHQRYLPAAAFVAPDARGGRLIIGDAILAFHAGFRDNLVDDLRLGYRSGRKADVIVVNDRYREWFDRVRRREPQVSQYINSLLEKQYARVYDNGSFQVYRRKQVTSEGNGRKPHHHPASGSRPIYRCSGIEAVMV